MKNILFLLSSLLICLSAQAQDKAPANIFVYTSYFSCDASMLSSANSLFKSELSPIYQQAVKDKKILGWGWMSHHTGGYWNKALYHIAPSVSGLLNAQNIMNELGEKNKSDRDNLFNRMCDRHEDYIWKVIAGNKGNKRGKVGLSMYMECDIASEKHADDIVKSVFAPMLNQVVDKGQFTSWGWLEHIIGGKYRRLATMTAENYDDLIKTRAKLNEKMFGKDAPKEALEFTKICGSHRDYLWDLTIESTQN